MTAARTFSIEDMDNAYRAGYEAAIRDARDALRYGLRGLDYRLRDMKASVPEPEPEVRPDCIGIVDPFIRAERPSVTCIGMAPEPVQHGDERCVCWDCASAREDDPTVQHEQAVRDA